MFLIGAKGLNGQLNWIVKKRLLKGIVVGENLKFTHLQFVDDTSIFGEAIDDNVWVVKFILRTFELVSELKINYIKSQILGIHVDDTWL